MMYQFELKEIFAWKYEWKDLQLGNWDESTRLVVENDIFCSRPGGQPSPVFVAELE